MSLTNRYAARVLKDNFDAPILALLHPLQCSRCNFATFRLSEAVEHMQSWDGHCCFVIPAVGGKLANSVEDLVP